jgi:uncharacterized protein (TIGR01244 family)
MRTHRVASFASTLVVMAAIIGHPAAQQSAKMPLDGARNFARVETTVACAGAIDPAVALPGIRKLGFVSVINLRESTEANANVEEERQTAEGLGLKYFHVPFNAASPKTAAADAFLAAIRTPGAEPAFIHCASGNRAATMWLIKRVVVDHWATDAAVQEATDLGQTSPALRQFALDYAAAHK